MTDTVQYFTCQCYTPHHFIAITRWDDDEDDHTIFNLTTDGTAPLWTRIKSAAAYIFRSQDLCTHDVILEGGETIALRDALTAIIEKRATTCS